MSSDNLPEIFEYIRLDGRFPHILCPGCGIGTVMNAMVRAFTELKLNKNRLCVVSGIGCSSRVPGYLDCDTYHTLHGRALPSATGVKLARPELEVVVIGGDGDILAIGGNHFIHTARRNINLSLIIINNFNYGMTGGQFSPTTPVQAIATTAPYGNLERGFNISEIAKSAGAVLVTRSTTYHAVHLKNMIKKAIQKKGFTVVEAISQCPTLYGRMNRLGSAVKMLEWLRDNTVSVAAPETKENENKLKIGVLWETESEEYTEVYQNLIKKAKGEKV
ncbi:MAG: thiamine pyrophosphate-dependent enzyme [candidate division WOR-3 bacterium]|nr:thiamine pyrophosphate-dependent enzyme [candidate division WOR-3 bacterium]